MAEVPDQNACSERLEKVAATLNKQLESLQSIANQILVVNNSHGLAMQTRTDQQVALLEGSPKSAPQLSSPAAVEKKVMRFDETRTVQVSIFVKGIFSLDTIAQTFGVQMGVIMVWACPEGEEPPPPEEDDGDWEPDWTPKYRIRNLMEEMSAEVMYAPKTVNGVTHIQMEAEHLVTIYEQLELQSFPTDLQDLTIEIESKVTTERVKWSPPVGEGEKLARVAKSKCYLNDFALIQKCPFTYNMFVNVSDHREVSALRVNLKVARKSSYYLINVNALMGAICLFSLCAWSSHPADIASRQAIDFNLILTAVFFKLVLTQMLPPLSYVTTLDVYVISSFVLILAVTISHSVLPYSIIKKVDASPLTMPPLSYDLEDELIAADMVSFWVFVATMVAFNILYFVYFYVKKNSDYKKFVQTGLRQQEEYDKDHDEKVKCQNRDTSGPSAFARGLSLNETPTAGAERL